LREFLLDNHQIMHAETEALLMFAARREHLDKVILPAVDQGSWVISDRFTDASFAYQGGGRGISAHKLAQLEDWVQGDFQPYLTLYLDVGVELGRQRTSVIKKADRFEKEQDEFFRRVRDAYLERARSFPQRMVVIDATQPLEYVKKSIEDIVLKRCK
jgi:dTMP kinase